MFSNKKIIRIFSILFAIILGLTQVGSVHAVDTGSVSGTVYDNQGNPITGMEILVQAVLISDGSEVGSTFSNPANGSYIISGLPLDIELAVVASNEVPDTDGYTGKYFSKVWTLDWAELITLESITPNRTLVDFVLTDGFGIAIEQLTFNVRAGHLLNDVNIRKAIAYGTDRQALFNNAMTPYGVTGELIHSMITPDAWFFANPADLTVYNLNQTQAQSILTSTGWVDTDADGIRENASNEELTLDFITTAALPRVASANVFKDQMLSIGILVNVLTYPGDVFFNTDPNISPLAAANFDIAEFAWASDASYDHLPTMYNTGDFQNMGGYSGTALDGYFEEARIAKTNGELNNFEANALLWQQEFANELPALPLFTRSGFPSAPSFAVRSNDDHVEGWNWANGSTVTIDVDTNGDGTPEASHTALVGPAPWNPNEIRFDSNFTGEVDIVAGTVVTVTDGTTTKSLTVSTHSITNIDLNTDIVFGTSDPGAMVDVWVCNANDCNYNRHVTANAVTGNWQVDFANPGTGSDEQTVVDIGPGTWVDSSQSDEDGDSTMFGVNVPNPNFAVRANDNRVEGWEWGNGTTVTIKIDREGDGTPEITRTAITGPAPWNPSEIRFDYNFWGVFDIQPGDHVSVTDGSITKNTIVSQLAFTDIDLDNDIVTGIASPGANVGVWVCDDSDCNYNRHVIADNTTGVWQVNFGTVGTEPDEQTVIDITYGTWVDSGEWDENNDGTMYGINVPNPFVEANVQSNWVHTREWPDGTLMTMEIDDLSNGLGGVDYTQTATMGQAPWNPGDPYDIVADFDMSGFTLEAGDEITVYGDLNGDLVTKHLIVSALQITDLNMANDTISGYATPDHEVEVCFNQPNGCISHSLIADTLDGSWTADYALDLDMQLGDNGWAAEYDADNDRTWVDWGTERPHIDAWYMDDQISAYGWLLGEEVTLEIENPSTALSPDYSTTAFVEVAPWDPNQTHVGFDLSGIFDYKPGMTITVYNSSATKELLVTNVTVTKVDIATDIVTGKAPSKQAMWMWFADSCCRNFKANLNGVWSVNFSVPGPNGEPVADIIPDSSGTVNAQDADGDNTSVNWSAPSLQTATIKSNSIYDGWILESSETSTLGGTMNNTATTITLGDDASDRQYRAILHFDTSILPNTAVITSATLKVKQQSVSATNPFNVLGSLYVDMRNPAFGLPGLELLDFNLAAKKVKPAVFSSTPADGWYSARFNNAGKLYINLLGTSQLRLYFSLDDNNNNIANLIRFYSGNAAGGDRPKLIIQYYVP